jgi:hypothetical protein
MFPTSGGLTNDLAGPFGRYRTGPPMGDPG